MDINEYQKRYAEIVNKYFDNDSTDISDEESFGNLTYYTIGDDSVFAVNGEVLLVIESIDGERYTPEDYFEWLDKELSLMEAVG